MLTLAKALARKGLRVAIIVYGEPGDVPTDVEGVSIVTRRPYRKIRKLMERVPETIRIWRSLWEARAQTIVYMAVGSELGVIAFFARIASRRLVYASASICDFDPDMLMRNRARLVRRTDLFAYRLGIRLAQVVVAQTQEQRVLCESGFGRSPLLIDSIGPSVDPENKAPEAFLWVGRLVTYKRPLAYIALARAMPEARFWMVGVPEPHGDEGWVAEQVAGAAVDVPNLELLAPRPHAELQGLMARAVASVSTGDFEGMPNVLLEAWSKGVPALVLSHDPGGVVENFGLGGYAHGSPGRLVELAREQWHNRYDRTSLSEQCRQYIRDHHAPEHVAQQWQSMLSVLERSGRVA